MSVTAQILETRLSRLERENRIWRWVGLLATVLLVLTVVVLSLSKPTQSRVEVPIQNPAIAQETLPSLRTNELLIVDKQGTVCATLNCDQHGGHLKINDLKRQGSGTYLNSAGVFLRDASTHTSLMAHALEIRGLTPHSNPDDASTVPLSIRIARIAEVGIPVIELYNPFQQRSVIIQTNKSNQGTVAVCDQNGKIIDGLMGNGTR